MSPAQPEGAWSDFVHAFFSPPNDLSPAADEPTGKFIAWAKEAWLRSPASPFFLPVSASGWTYWYAICPDQEQRLWVRDLIRAYLGSWAGFSGPQPVPVDSDMPLDQAVRTLIGPDGCSFRLLIPRNANAETSVRQSVIRLTRSLAARPYRQIHLTWPLGRLISDFSDACASGSESSAEETLALLEQDHRLSGANKLFLRLQYLAAFARWTDLEESGHLPDLIRLHRPVLASDALARLVMARLPGNGQPRGFRGISIRVRMPRRFRNHDQVCGWRTVLRLLVDPLWRAARGRRGTPARCGLAGSGPPPQWHRCPTTRAGQIRPTTCCGAEPG